MVAFMSDAAGVCLLSRYPESALVCRPILPSLHSYGYTRYSIYMLFLEWGLN
jgi:hypothetical protein